MLDTLFTLLWVLSPLVIGFWLPIPSRYMPLINRLLSVLVWAILLLIGMSLAQVHDIGAQFGAIARYVIWLAVCCMGSGLIGLMLLDRRYPLTRTHQTSQDAPNLVLSGTFMQLACLGVGFGIGRMLPIAQGTLSWGIKLALALLILSVGIGLAHSGLRLREVLLDKRGALISLVFCVSVAVGGAIFALTTPSVSLTQGLALSSGYGWYSLSGILMTDRYGAVWGTVALLNDLLRELCALLLIPLIMPRYPSAAVGLGGATSLDFMLPVIQSSGGNTMIPLALSFGCITNLLAPLLMVTFAHFG